MSELNLESFSELYLPLLSSALRDAPNGDAWRKILSDETVVARLHGVCDSLIDNAKRFNLTAITEPSAVVEKHAIDSLLPLVYLEEATGVFSEAATFPEAAFANAATSDATESEVGKYAPSRNISRKISPRLIDVGSGAGFPSLPLGAVLCDRGFKILAVDATAKKTRHIAETAEKIGVSGSFQTVAARAEELAHGNFGAKSEKAANASHNKLRESFGIATARAVAALPTLIELCGAFVEVGGYFVAMKGKCDEEIALAAPGAKKMGFAPCQKIEYRLPCGDARSIALYRKIRPTEIVYPRPFAKITAKPLG